MVNDARSPLYGQVEADETIIGGKIKGKRGRGVISDSKKSLVLGAVEVISYDLEEHPNNYITGKEE